jgi:Family of unknown function (DUF5941)
MAKKPTGRSLIPDQADLFGVRRSFTERFDWIEPSILRLIEGAFLIWIFASSDQVNIAAYMIIFSIVFHHYDNLYRALQNETKPRWLSALGLYVGGRILLVGIAVQQEWPLEILAWYFSALFLVVSSLQWVLSHRANKMRK